MKRLAAALLVLAGVAGADELQSYAPAFCNGQGYCGSQLSAAAIDAGLDLVGQDCTAFHVIGNHNAPATKCVPQAGGWWKTCTIVQGDNFTGTLVLSDGDGGVNPIFTANEALATV